MAKPKPEPATILGMLAALPAKHEAFQPVPPDQHQLADKLAAAGCATILRAPGHLAWRRTNLGDQLLHVTRELA